MIKFMKGTFYNPAYGLRDKAIHECGFYISNNPELTNEEIEKICNLLK